MATTDASPANHPFDPFHVAALPLDKFRDADGNSFALVGFDAFNQEIEAQRQRIAEKQEAERRAAQELEIAKQVQARLFPQSMPRIETLEYAGICVQARQVAATTTTFWISAEGASGW